MHRPILNLVLLLSAWFLQNCGNPGADPLAHRRAMWRADVAELDGSLSLLAMALRANAPDSLCRSAFLLARSRYKAREFLWEYAFPATARKLNGSAVDEAERDDEATVIPAEGLQVLEALLFPSVSGDLDRRAEVVEAMRRALAAVSGAETFEPIGHGTGTGTNLIHRPLAFTDSSLLDAVRLEIFRLGSLGLTGFDSPLALQSLPETRESLLGMEAWLAAAFPDPADFGRKADAAFDSLRSALGSAAAAAAGDFAAFDRLAFLTGRLNPAYAALSRFQGAAGIPLPREPRAFDPAASDMYSAQAWNPDFFGTSFYHRPGAAPASRADMAHLGRRLFSDPSLSGDGSRSCATCHLPGNAFTDGLRRSLALPGRKPISRNSPSLLHAAFQQGSFWDLRAESLEDQASQVVHNPSEMGGSLDSAAARLSGIPAYAADFQRAFAADPDNDRDAPVTPLRIRRALAAYIRSLAPLDSPWDRSMRGDSGALTAEARHGFNVFMGKAKCATCHFPPLFNGTVPPRFLESDLEVLGVPAEADPARASLDPDPGRMDVDRSPLSRGAFRTPTVRNADLTAPYMHNGVFATLEEVVEFYDEGGGAGRGLAVPNQTLPADTLRLTVAEEKALIAFMKSLTDTAGTTATAAPAALHTASGR